MGIILLKKSSQKLKEHAFVAPFLLGIYPVLALLAGNSSQIPFSEGVRALVVALFGAGVVLGLLIFLLRNREKAAVLTSLYVILFFAYGHVYLFLERGNWLGLPLGRHRYLGPLTLAVILGAGWGVWRTKRHLTSLVRTANLVAALLVLFPIVQMSYGGIRSFAASQGVARTGYDVVYNVTPTLSGLPNASGETPPDIYYLLLDGYPRADMLRTTFHFDNQEFLDFLTSKGFYIARCSQSNYNMTISSMASIFNLKYIHEESGEGIQMPEDYVMENLIKNSDVQEFVEAMGYTTVNFEMNYHFIQWVHADRYLSPLDSSLNKYMLQTGLNEFELLLVKTSAALIFFDLKVASIENQTVDLYSVLEANPRRVHRERLYFIFDTLERIPETIPGPKFVYAHIISPHPPYLFDAQGNFIVNEQPASEELAAYREQVIYLNTRVEAIVNALFALSEQPPLIIIQSDHGALIDYQANHVDGHEKIANFSAFYFPGQDYSRLYPTITPVNTFRLVFDQFFGSSFGLLEDQSVYGNEWLQFPCSE